MTEKKQQHKKKRGKVQHIRGSPKKRKYLEKLFFLQRVSQEKCLRM